MEFDDDAPPRHADAGRPVDCGEAVVLAPATVKVFFQ